MTNPQTPAFDLKKHLDMKKQADRLCDVIAQAIHNIKIALPVDASLLRAPETLDKKTNAVILNNSVQLTASCAEALLQAEIDRRTRGLSDGLRKLTLIKAILADELDGKALSYFANYGGNVKILVSDEFLRAEGETFTLRESASSPLKVDPNA